MTWLFNKSEGSFIMEIKKNETAGKVTLELQGRLDTLTSPELSDCVDEVGQDMEICFDLTGLEYISSSGLRVLLSTLKKYGSRMTVCNIRPEIMGVFEVTGFDEILNIV